MKFPALLLTFLTLPALAIAADWPQFRGPEGDGIVRGISALPLKWSATDNVAWRTAIPGKGWSSPSLADGKIFLTTAAEAEKGDLSLRALCLNAADGKVLWDNEVFPQKAGGNIHRKNSHASPTPLVADGRVYVHFGHQGTACLDLSGKKLWEQRSLTYSPVHGGGCSPQLIGKHLIFTADGAEAPFIAALNKDDGSVAWKVQRDNASSKKKFSFCTPSCFTVNGRQELISPASDGVFAYDPASGTELWKIRYDGYSVIPKPVMAHGLVFFSTGYDNPVTYAVRPGGTGDVTDTHTAWTQDKRAPNTPSMLVHGNELYTVADNGIVACLDAKTGEIHWSERAGKECSASPILFKDRIYVLDEFGTCTVVQADKSGFKVLAKNPLGDVSTLSSITPDEGALFIRTADALYCIREK